MKVLSWSSRRLESQLIRWWCPCSSIAERMMSWGQNVIAIVSVKASLEENKKTEKCNEV